MASLIYYFILILLALTLSACGGGGGDDSTDGEDVGNDVSDSQNINGGLTGRLYTKEQNEGWAVDLASGNVSQLPDKQWMDTGEYSGYSVYFNPHPNHDGSEFLLFVDGCYREFEGITNDFDCLSIINSTGNLITSRNVLSDGILDARQSKNGNYVAMVYADESLVGPLAYLVIYDRNFIEVISESAMRRTGIGSDSRFLEAGLDWSPNGQIVYAYAKSIFITSPYTAEGVPLLTLPDSDAPNSNKYPIPAAPKVSPDGTKVAFRYVTETNQYQAFATIWVMNIDGTDLHQLSYDPDALYQMFNSIAWSPDGKFILTKAGGFGSDPLTGGAQNKLYAIPSSSRNVPLDCDGSDGVICVRTYFKSPDSLTNVFHPYGSEFEWIE
jgi:hypothetical protein